MLFQRLAEELGSEVVGATAVSDGDVNEALRVQLADDRIVFVKTHHQPPPNFYRTESSGLAWLAEPGALDVASVVAWSDESPAFLALDWIEPGPPGPLTEEEFGRGLARLHRAGAPCFGRIDRATTGSRRLPNEPCDVWSDFYAGQRLEPLRRLATDSGALSDRALQNLDRVVDRIGELVGPPETPARLHGDLWAGNRLVDRSGRSWLIDPAAHGGHREFDLAMMLLFGGFSPDCFAAYDEEFPLDAEWRHRVPLHHLAPLVVHAIKFGGSYPGAVDQALARVLQPSA